MRKSSTHSPTKSASTWRDHKQVATIELRGLEAESFSSAGQQPNPLDPSLLNMAKSGQEHGQLVGHPQQGPSTSTTTSRGHDDAPSHLPPDSGRQRSSGKPRASHNTGSRRQPQPRRQDEHRARPAGPRPSRRQRNASSIAFHR